MDVQENWIFRSDNAAIRDVLIVACAGASFICYSVLNNIVCGSLFLFFLLYLFGGLKCRLGVDIIKNGTVESAISELCKLYSTAQGSITILTGSVNPLIYNNADILSALTSASQRGVKIRIFTDYSRLRKAHNYNLDAFNISILRLVFDRRIELYAMDRDISEINHFTLIDNISFRFEKKHKDEEAREAVIAYHARIARRLMKIVETFDRLIKEEHIKPISSDQIFFEFVKKDHTSMDPHRVG